MFIRKKKNEKKTNNLRPIHLALVNDNIITTESVELALSRMDEEKIGVHIERIEVIPFLRNLMLYINQYKLDLVIMDGDMEKQDVSLYIQRIKNFDKDIKIIVLAKIITPQLETLYNKNFIDQYITLPFQDANLWAAITKVLNNEIDKNKTDSFLLEENKEYKHKKVEDLEEDAIDIVSVDDINILNEDNSLPSQDERDVFINVIEQDDEVFNLDDDSDDVFDLTSNKNTVAQTPQQEKKLNVFEYAKQMRIQKTAVSDTDDKTDN